MSEVGRWTPLFAGALVAAYITFESPISGTAETNFQVGYFMSQSDKMICPECGAEMNHHAMKIDYDMDDWSSVDPVFGGVLKEAHTCPECGWIELRSA
jgi:predicted RNA-binding Zn-ribbon protein involved in translation (DUF1610 family)